MTYKINERHLPETKLSWKEDKRVLLRDMAFRSGISSDKCGPKELDKGECTVKNQMVANEKGHG